MNAGEIKRRVGIFRSWIRIKYTVSLEDPKFPLHPAPLNPLFLSPAATHSNIIYPIPLPPPPSNYWGKNLGQINWEKNQGNKVCKLVQTLPSEPEKLLPEPLDIAGVVDLVELEDGSLGLLLLGLGVGFSSCASWSHHGGRGRGGWWTPSGSFRLLQSARVRPSSSCLPMKMRRYWFRGDAPPCPGFWP